MPLESEGIPIDDPSRPYRSVVAAAAVSSSGAGADFAQIPGVQGPGGPVPVFPPTRRDPPGPTDPASGGGSSERRPSEWGVPIAPSGEAGGTPPSRPPDPSASAATPSGPRPAAADHREVLAPPVSPGHRVGAEEPAYAVEHDDQSAGRLTAMASGPASAESVRRALLWVAREVQANGQAMRAATDQVASLADRVAAIEAREQARSNAEASETITREAEFLWRETEARTSAMGRTTEQLEATVRELAAFYGQVADRLGGLETRLGTSTSDGVREELDLVALEVSGTPDFSELARAALRSRLVEDSVSEIRTEIERMTRTQVVGQQDALAHVAGRTAPLEGALHELRREVDLVAEETATAQEALRTEASDKILAMAERVQALESLPQDVEGILRELDRVTGRLDESAEVSGAAGGRVAELAEHVQVVEARLAAVDDRTAALVALSSDVEGVYQELDRIAQLTQARDGTLTRLADWAPPVEVSVSGLRQQIAQLAADVEVQRTGLEETGLRIEAVAQDGQNAELDLRRRLGSVEPLAGELEGLYREMGRLAATTTESEERVVLLDATATTHTEVLDELRLRLDQTRTGVEELASGLSARLRVIEVLPEEVERVAVELDHLVVELGDTRQEAAVRHSSVSETLSSLASLPADIEGVHRALDMVAADLVEARVVAATGLEAAAGRITDLQSLSTDVEGLYRELDRVAEASRLRGERLAEVEGRSASVEAVAELQAELDRVTSELRSEVDRAAVDLRDELDGLGREVVESRGEPTARLETLAGIVHELERLPADVGALYRELERLDEVDRRRGEQLAALEVRIAPDDLARLHTQLEAASLAIRGLETLPAEVEGLYRELDRLTELNRERAGQLAELEGRTVPREVVSRLEAELATIATDQADVADVLLRRLGDIESLPAAVERAFRDLDRLATELEELRGKAASDSDALRTSIAALETLPADVEGMSWELLRLDEANEQRDAQLTDIEARTAPKEAVTSLVGDLDRLTAEIDALPIVIDGISRDVEVATDGLRRDLAGLSSEVKAVTDGVRRDLAGVSSEVEVATDGLRRDLAGLSSDTAVATDGLRRDLAGLSSDTVVATDGLRRDLAGLSSDTAAIRREAAEAAAPLHAAVADLRRDLEALREATSLAEADDELTLEGLRDLDARLTAVESLPERVEKVFRELSRASGDVVSRQQASLDQAVAKLDGIEERLTAIESVPADLEGLYAALYRVAESVKALREEPDRS